jgi:hypothetical protein
LSVPINKLPADVRIYAESVWMEHDASGGPPDRDFLSMVQEFVDDSGRYSVAARTAAVRSQRRTEVSWRRRLSLGNPQGPRNAEDERASLRSGLGRILVVVLEEGGQVLRGQNETGLKTNAMD